MFRKETKAFLTLYLLLIIIILFSFSFSFSAKFGFWILIIDGLVASIISVLLVDDLKKYQNNFFDKLFIVVAINLILYGSLLLSYSFSNIGIGKDYAFVAFAVLYLYIIAGIISAIVGWSKMFSSHTKVQGRKPNLYIYLVSVVVLILVPYNFMVYKIAVSTKNPSLCYITLGVKYESILFSTVMKDRCLTDLGAILNDPSLCETNECINKVAYKNVNLAACNHIDAGSNCVMMALLSITAGDKTSVPDDMSPAYCDVLVDKSNKDQCLIDLAMVFKDKKYCLEVDDFLNCYARFADLKKNDDASQCDVLLSDKAKEVCQQYIRSDWITYP